MSCFCAGTDCFAQYPPPFPKIHLADIPSQIADGSSYVISGTVEGISDGEEIHVSIGNQYTLNGVSLFSSANEDCEVIGGAFSMGISFIFSGLGSYNVTATHNGQVSDTEQGMVQAPQ